jgi:hypothetical protein
MSLGHLSDERTTTTPKSGTPQRFLLNAAVLEEQKQKHDIDQTPSQKER